MVQILGRRMILPQYLFSSFSLLFLLDFNSINELVLLSGLRRMTFQSAGEPRVAHPPERRMIFPLQRRACSHAQTSDVLSTCILCLSLIQLSTISAGEPLNQGLDKGKI